MRRVVNLIEQVDLDGVGPGALASDQGRAVKRCSGFQAKRVVT